MSDLGAEANDGGPDKCVGELEDGEALKERLSIKEVCSILDSDA